jgi:diadenosine tetraphosphate (Ap4A) HIT family hydrolase
MAHQQQPSLPGCPFCAIGTTYPPSPSPNPDHELLSPPAFVVLSSPLCLAFLDIMPLAPGHLLVTTRAHREKISEVGEDESRELGLWLPRLSRVLANVTGVYDWNIVQNNGIYNSPWKQKVVGLEYPANIFSS